MKHVALLKGGWSSEREVSLKSGAACAKALRECGYKVTEIDVAPDIASVLAALKPDVVFNALHGRFGEDGTIQGLLDLMQIPYTHSGVLASALAMDKPMAKRIFGLAGIPIVADKIVTYAELQAGDPLPRPYVIKPANEGSSVGVYIITQEDNRNVYDIVPAPKEGTNYMAEAYVAGRELTVAVLDGAPLGATEIRIPQGFYDYKNKYTAGGSEHLCPAPLPPEQYEQVCQLAAKAHQAIGCRGLSRSDFRFDGKTFYILEINTQPGMTELSLSPELAAHAGISFPALVDRLIAGARHG